MFSFLYRKNNMNEQMRNYLKHSTNESIKRILENKNRNTKLDLTENTYTINKNNYKSSNSWVFLSLTSLLYYFYSNRK
jgi:predicted membrane chloride channel (bestrophin family)